MAEEELRFCVSHPHSSRLAGFVPCDVAAGARIEHARDATSSLSNMIRN
jgi:hypothetical protein